MHSDPPLPCGLKRPAGVSCVCSVAKEATGKDLPADGRYVVGQLFMPREVRPAHPSQGRAPVYLRWGCDRTTKLCSAPRCICSFPKIANRSAACHVMRQGLTLGCVTRAGDFARRLPHRLRGHPGGVQSQAHRLVRVHTLHVHWSLPYTPPRAPFRKHSPSRPTARAALGFPIRAPTAQFPRLDLSCFVAGARCRPATTRSGTRRNSRSPV
jgi:hypothetical protein